MRQEEIATFTRKIAASNPTELICVLYEIYFTYEAEALQALDDGDQSAYVQAVRQGGQVIEHLKNALDFTYPVAGQLYALYDYAERQMARAMYRKDKEDIANAGKVMGQLQEAFAEVAKADQSEPVMRNAQQITAGMTYGRGDVNETMGSMDASRGYWA